jgi:hypothetical protein
VIPWAITFGAGFTTLLHHQAVAYFFVETSQDCDRMNAFRSPVYKTLSDATNIVIEAD